MSSHEELKRAAIQRKNELEHFGIPGTFQIDPDAFLSILAELEVSNNVGRALGDTISSVCDSRDALVRVNVQIKAENERLAAHIADGMDCKAMAIKGMGRLIAENEALRKEIELSKANPLYSTRANSRRYVWLRDNHIGDNPDAINLECGPWPGLNSAIDAAMGSGEQA